MNRLTLPSTLLAALLFTLLFSASASATKVFHEDYPVFKEAPVYIIADQDLDFKVEEFCVAIYRNNPTVSSMKCRIGASFMRDSNFANYLDWISRNLHKSADASFLKTRDSLTAEKLRNLYAEYILYLVPDPSTKGTWAVMFQGEKSFPAALYYYKDSGSLKSLLDPLAADFFSKPSERIPTEEEREVARKNPNIYYREKLSLDHFYGVGAAYTSGAPVGISRNFWLGGQPDTRVQDFRRTSSGDSSSLWDWMQDDALMYILRGGVVYGKTLGADLQVRYSEHDVRINPNDPVYSGLTTWNYQRIEVGMQAKMGKTYFAADWLELMPAFFVGFTYSYHIENFEHSSPLPEDATVRFKTEKVYKGALGGVSLRALAFDKVALHLETGLSGRGRSVDQSTSPDDDSAQKEIIGKSTIDYYTGVSLEWNFRRYLD